MERERGDEMLPGLALQVLRLVRNVSQEKLARSLGMAPSTLSAMENGSMPRRDLLHAAAAMKLAPQVIEWTVDLLLRIERSDSLGGELGEEDQDLRERRRIVAFFGRWVEELTLHAIEERDRRLIAHEENRQAEILVEHLRWLSQESRLAVVQECPRYHFRRFVLRLCAESLKATADSAKLAREWAELAVLAARHIPGSEGEKSCALGYAKVYLANAHRVQGELKAANRDYEEGSGLLEQGDEADLEGINQARVLGFGASLRRAQRRFEEALELLERALKVDDGLEAPYLLLNKARLLRDIGDLEGAVEVLTDAEPFLDEVINPRLRLVAQVNFVDHLSILGLYDEARKRLPIVWRLTDDTMGELDRIRLVWVQARVSAGLGDEEEGIAALEQVRRAFGAREMVYDGALASLELATLRLRRGETSEVRSLAREMTPVFKNQDIHREALAALAIFCKAVERDDASVALAEALVRFLHRARYNPDLKFTPEQAIAG